MPRWPASVSRKVILPYELSNLVLLHPNCHRQLHSCEVGSLKKGL
ncbi:HNH endonuclease [Shigella dysenteriae]